MTKPLTRPILEYLRSNIMGWTARLNTFDKDPKAFNLIHEVMSWENKSEK